MKSECKNEKFTNLTSSLNNVDLKLNIHKYILGIVCPDDCHSIFHLTSHLANIIYIFIYTIWHAIIYYKICIITTNKTIRMNFAITT